MRTEKNYCIPKPSDTQRELALYIPWVQEVADGNNRYKDHVDHVILEVQKWIKKEKDVYTVDRKHYHTIVFIYEICERDLSLKEWIATFHPETATHEEYQLFHGSLVNYNIHLNSALAFVS